jgi:hypothetical protein
MAITIFTIPPMSAGPGGKYPIAPERIRLGATMVKMAECLKSWIDITPAADNRRVLFAKSRFVRRFQIVSRSLE